MDQLASGNIPQLDEAIIPTAGKGVPIWREDHTEDQVRMPTRPEERPAGHIPELDRAIPTASGQRAFIRAKGERKEIVAVRLPGQGQALASLMPDPHLAPPAACGPQLVPVRLMATDQIACMASVKAVSRIVAPHSLASCIWTPCKEAPRRESCERSRPRRCPRASRSSAIRLAGP